MHIKMVENNISKPETSSFIILYAISTKILINWFELNHANI